MNLFEARCSFLSQNEIAEVTSQITKHFEECVMELNKRKEYLLSEVDHIFNEHSIIPPPSFPLFLLIK